MKKTLSDKQWANLKGDIFYPEKDVKEFIKEFIEKCKCNNCRDLIRELAGKELLNSPQENHKSKDLRIEDTSKKIIKGMKKAVEDVKHGRYTINKKPEWMWDRYDREKKEK